MNRFVTIFLVFAFTLILPFIFAGDYFEGLFNQVQTEQMLDASKGWGWSIGILLLVLDLFLPIPSTIVMTALGTVYGPVFGGLTASIGCFLSGFLAYELSRKFGARMAFRFLGRNNYRKGRYFFNDFGGWFIVLTKFLPIISEVVACFSGFHKMNRIKFLIALAFGSLCFGFTFALLGNAAKDSWIAITLINTLVPAILWIFALKFFTLDRLKLSKN